MPETLTIIVGTFLFHQALGVLTGVLAARLDRHLPDPLLRHTVNHDVQEALQQAWNKTIIQLFTTYRDSREYTELSHAERTLVNQRAKLLVEQNNVNVLFPSVTDLTTSQAAGNVVDPLFNTKHEAVTRALIAGLGRLELWDGLPGGLQGILRRQLLNGLTYQFVEIAVKRKPKARDALFFRLLLTLQEVTGKTEEEITALWPKMQGALEQLEGYQRWSQEVLVETLDQVRVEVQAMHLTVQRIDNRQRKAYMRDLRDTLDFAERDLNHISAVRLEAKPQIAVGMVNDLVDFLGGLERRMPTKAGLKYLLRMRAQALLQHYWIYAETLTDDVVAHVTPVFGELLATARNPNADPGIAGIAYFVQGDAYYIDGYYQASVRLFEEALAKDLVNDVYIKLMLMRTLALDWAYLQEEFGELAVTKVKELAIKIEQLIGEEGANLQPEQISEVYEGLGRAQRIISLEGALETLDRSRKEYARLEAGGQNVPFRSFQIVRSELVVIQHYETRDAGLLAEVEAKWLGLEKSYGHQYPRPEKQIKQLIEKLSLR